MGAASSQVPPPALDSSSSHPTTNAMETSRGDSEPCNHTRDMGAASSQLPPPALGSSSTRPTSNAMETSRGDIEPRNHIRDVGAASSQLPPPALGSSSTRPTSNAMETSRQDSTPHPAPPMAQSEIDARVKEILDNLRVIAARSQQEVTPRQEARPATQENMNVPHSASLNAQEERHARFTTAVQAAQDRADSAAAVAARAQQESRPSTQENMSISRSVSPNIHDHTERVADFRNALQVARDRAARAARARGLPRARTRSRSPLPQDSERDMSKYRRRSPHRRRDDSISRSSQIGRRHRVRSPSPTAPPPFNSIDNRRRRSPGPTAMARGSSGIDNRSHRIVCQPQRLRDNRSRSPAIERNRGRDSYRSNFRARSPLRRNTSAGNGSPGSPQGRQRSRSPARSTRREPDARPRDTSIRAQVTLPASGDRALSPRATEDQPSNQRERSRGRGRVTSRTRGRRTYRGSSDRSSSLDSLELRARRPSCNFRSPTHPRRRELGARIRRDSDGFRLRSPFPRRSGPGYYYGGRGDRLRSRSRSQSSSDSRSRSRSPSRSRRPPPRSPRRNANNRHRAVDSYRPNSGRNNRSPARFPRGRNDHPRRPRERSTTRDNFNRRSSRRMSRSPRANERRFSRSPPPPRHRDYSPIHSSPPARAPDSRRHASASSRGREWSPLRSGSLEREEGGPMPREVLLGRVQERMERLRQLERRLLAGQRPRRIYRIRNRHRRLPGDPPAPSPSPSRRAQGVRYLTRGGFYAYRDPVIRPNNNAENNNNLNNNVGYAVDQDGVENDPVSRALALLIGPVVAEDPDLVEFALEAIGRRLGHPQLEAPQINEAMDPVIRPNNSADNNNNNHAGAAMNLDRFGNNRWFAAMQLILNDGDHRHDALFRQILGQRLRVLAPGGQAAIVARRREAQQQMDSDEETSDEEEARDEGEASDEEEASDEGDAIDDEGEASDEDDGVNLSGDSYRIADASEEEAAGNTCSICLEEFGTSEENCKKPMVYTTIECQCKALVGEACIRTWHADSDRCLFCRKRLGRFG